MTMSTIKLISLIKHLPSKLVTYNLCLSLCLQCFFSYLPINKWLRHLSCKFFFFFCFNMIDILFIDRVPIFAAIFSWGPSFAVVNFIKRHVVFFVHYFSIFFQLKFALNMRNCSLSLSAFSLFMLITVFFSIKEGGNSGDVSVFCLLHVKLVCLNFFCF